MASLHLVDYFIFSIALIFTYIFIFAQLIERNRKTSIIPFTEKCPRPPGQYLTSKMELLNEKIDERTFLSFASMVAVLLIPFINAIPDYTHIFIFVFIYFIFAPYHLFRLFRLIKKRSNYRLGYQGELVVAGKLNMLMHDGYHVFHDMPFDKFNIDHIVVGENGVFSIETKTRRKPKDKNSKAQYNVSYDGKRLNWPNFVEKDSLDQADRNARKLSDFLSKSTGEKVTAKPILIIPGWYIDRKVMGPIPVLNDKEVTSHIKRQENNRLSSEQIQRITHQISQKCELEE